jgi:hypothetical protein
MKPFLKWLPFIFVTACALLMAIIPHQMTPKTYDSGPALQAIQHAIEHAPTPNLDLSPIKEEVQQLGVLIHQMKDDHSVGALLENGHSQIQTKLDAMYQLIETLENTQHPIKYLPETALPFKILSIDSLQHISVATVFYNYKTAALEKGDSLAGWEVIAVDFATQSMEFESAEGTHIKTRLTGAEHA